MRLRSLLPPSLLALILLTVYLRTMSPGLSWAHYGADGGDLITAVFTGGVAHPSGYPLYLLAARPFQALPWGTLAWRTALLSAVSAAAAAILVYRLAWRNTHHLANAFTAGLAFGLAPLVWSQAIIAEVYGLHLLALAAALTLLLEASDFWAGLGIGLAAANHLTSLLLLPLRGKLRFSYLAGLACGLSLYLLLPLRALQQSPVNWGHVVSLQRFGWLLSGALYASQASLFTPALLAQRVSALAALMMSQMGVLGLLIAAIGLFSQPFLQRRSISLGAIALVSCAFSLLYNTADSFVYLLPAFLSLALWLADGLCWLQQFGRPFRAAALGLILLSLTWQTWQAWPQVDASRDASAETFGRQVMSSLPPRALVFASGDRAVFALWYFHFALGQRPDLHILASDLLGFDWYRETLAYTYSSLSLPPAAVFEKSLSLANPGLPVCQVSYTNWTQLYCLP